MTGRSAPIGTTPAWQTAAERAGEQCEHSGKSGRCARTLAGGHRLYLDPDGRLYCSDHHGPKQRPAAPAIETHQDSLF